MRLDSCDFSLQRLSGNAMWSNVSCLIWYFRMLTDKTLLIHVWTKCVHKYHDLSVCLFLQLSASVHGATMIIYPLHWYVGVLVAPLLYLIHGWGKRHVLKCCCRTFCLHVCTCSLSAQKRFSNVFAFVLPPGNTSSFPSCPNISKTTARKSTATHVQYTPHFCTQSYVYTHAADWHT